MKRFKSFDVFGFKPQLRIENEYSHKSIVGGCLTLCMLLIFVLAIAYTVGRNGNMIFANITQEVIIEREPSELILPKGNFLIMIGFSDRGLNNLTHSLFSIRMTQQTARAEIAFDRAPSEEEEIFLEPCASSHFKKLNTPHSTPTNFFRGMLCSPADKELRLRGDELSLRFSQVKLYVEACKNVSGSLQTCASKEVIEAALLEKSQLKLEVFFTTHQFNILNYQQNYTTDFEHLAFQISPRRLNGNIEIFLKELEMVSAYGLLPTNTETVSTSISSFDNDIREYFSIWEKDDRPYLTIFFRKSQKKRLITRDMIEFFRMLSYVGGLWNPIFIFFYLIARSYNQYSFNLAVANKIYFFQKTAEFQSNAQANLDSKMATSLEESLRNTKNLAVALRVRFSDLCCCLRSKRLKRQNMAKVIGSVWQEMDLPLILQKLHEISRIKRLLFDEKELQLFDSIPRRFQLDLNGQTRMDSAVKSPISASKSPKNAAKNPEVPDYGAGAEAYSQLKTRGKKTLTRRLLELAARELNEEAPVFEPGNIAPVEKDNPKMTELPFDEEVLKRVNS